jgi:hypothetical protein
LVCDVAGQAHTIPWRTDGRGRLREPGRFRDFVLFAGDVLQGLQATVTLVESDRAPFEDFRHHASLFLDMLGAWASTGAPYGPAVSAGCALVSSLVSYIGTRVEDDLELSYTGDLLPVASAGGPAEGGRDAVFCLERMAGGTDTAPGLRVGFRVHSLPTLAASRPSVLILEDIGFDLCGARCCGSRLLLDASFGSGRRAQPLRLSYTIPRAASRLSSVVRVRDRCVYRGPCSGVLPFFIDASVVSDDSLGAVGPVLDAGRNFREELVRLDTASRTAVRLEGDRFEALASGAQSMLNLALSFTSGSCSLGSVSGLLVLGEASHHETTGGSIRTVCPGRSFEVRVGSDGESALVFRFRLE